MAGILCISSTGTCPVNECRASLAGEGRSSLIAAAATRGRGGLMLGTTLVSTNTSFTPLTAVPHRGVEIRSGRGGGPRLTPRDSSTPGAGERERLAWAYSPMEISSLPTYFPEDMFPARHFPLSACIPVAVLHGRADNGTLTTFLVLTQWLKVIICTV